MRILIGVAMRPPERGVPLEPRTQTCLDALAFDGEIEIAYYDQDDLNLHGRDNLLVKHKQMRQRVLDEGFDALLCIESDMIVPPNVVTKLAALDADVGYAFFCSRHSGMLLCFEHIGEWSGRALNANPARARKVWGSVLPTEGAGFGCTLVRRHVFEQVDFRLDGKHDFWDDLAIRLGRQAGRLPQCARSIGHLRAYRPPAWNLLAGSERTEVVPH